MHAQIDRRGCHNRGGALDWNPHEKRYGNAGRNAGPTRSRRRSRGFRRKDSADLRAVGLPLAPALLGMVPALSVPVPLLGLAPSLLVGLASAPLVGLAPPLAPLVTGLLLGRTRQRRDEMGASLRQGEPARREGVPFQKKSGEREGIGKIGCR